MSLMRSLEIGKQALAAQQAAITTAGHNVANLSTPGYTRQRVALSNTALKELPAGVSLDAIQQIRDRFLETHLQRQTQELSRWQTQSHWLRQVETLFMNDGEIPLNTALGRFWDSWQDLANDPTSQAARETVIQRGHALVFEIHTLHQHLDDMVHQLNQQLNLNLDRVNGALERVADLNRSITLAEAGGQPANDLRDERQRLVMELAETMNVEVHEGPDEVFSLSVSGIELVRGAEVSPLTLSQEVRDGQPRFEIRQSNGESLPIRNGTFAGLLQVRDEVIPELRDRLDTFTRSLIQDVNAIHREGINSEAQTGLDFFSGTDASTIDVAITADRVATGRSASTLGDNSIALDIAQLRIEGEVGAGGQSYEAYFADLVARAGEWTQEATRFEENQTQLVESLKAQQQSVSGVSLDEEMASLIQFQRAYEASARYLSTVDELIQSVIGMVS